MFLVSLVKKVNGPPTQSINLPRDLYPGQPLEPVAVLARGMVQRGRVTITQVLIRWSLGFPEDDSWEFLYDSQLKFPNHHLEDKVAFMGKAMLQTEDANETN